MISAAAAKGLSYRIGRVAATAATAIGGGRHAHLEPMAIPVPRDAQRVEIGRVVRRPKFIGCDEREHAIRLDAAAEEMVHLNHAQRRQLCAANVERVAEWRARMHGAVREERGSTNVRLSSCAHATAFRSATS